jgi:hypothetical protein
MAFLMIVSVLRHTKSSVKFWFIQNFLSPSFKAFIPHMAKGEFRHPTTGMARQCADPPGGRACRIRIRLRARHVQVAALAPRSEGEAARNLGVRIDA